MPETALIADVLADLRGKCSERTFYLPNGRDELLNSVLAPLKDAPPEVAVEFALTGLRIVCEGPGSWFVNALNHAVGKVLRRKLAFTEDQVLEMIGLVSV